MPAHAIISYHGPGIQISNVRATNASSVRPACANQTSTSLQFTHSQIDLHMRYYTINPSLLTICKAAKFPGARPCRPR